MRFRPRFPARRIIAIAGRRESLRNRLDKLAGTTTDREQIPTIPDRSDP
ncbi:hypothetical protein ABZ814_11010 [Micromonospora musae]